MTDVRRDAIKELNAARAIKDAISQLTDDEDAIRDTLEGETNLDGMVRAVMLSIEEDQLLVDGCAERIDDLQSRQARFKDRIAYKRGLIEQALSIAEVKKMELDIATVSLRAVPQALIVKDESLIPSKFFKTEVKLDKKALLAALKDDEQVDGAELSNGGQTISIRRA